MERQTGKVNNTKENKNRTTFYRLKVLTRLLSECIIFRMKATENLTFENGVKEQSEAFYSWV